MQGNATYQSAALVPVNRNARLLSRRRYLSAMPHHGVQRRAQDRLSWAGKLCVHPAAFAKLAGDAVGADGAMVGVGDAAPGRAGETDGAQEMAIRRVRNDNPLHQEVCDGIILWSRREQPEYRAHDKLTCFLRLPDLRASLSAMAMACLLARFLPNFARVRA